MMDREPFVWTKAIYNMDNFDETKIVVAVSSVYQIDFFRKINI